MNSLDYLKQKAQLVVEVTYASGTIGSDAFEFTLTKKDVQKLNGKLHHTKALCYLSDFFVDCEDEIKTIVNNTSDAEAFEKLVSLEMPLSKFHFNTAEINRYLYDNGYDVPLLEDWAGKTDVNMKLSEACKLKLIDAFNEKTLHINMWDSEQFDLKQHFVDCYFNDLSGAYSGNVYLRATREPVGDWTGTDSSEIEAVLGVAFD